MTIDFLQGTYDSKEATELLAQLFLVKIRFHERRIHSGLSEEDIKMRERCIARMQGDFDQIRRFLGTSSGSVTLEGSLNLNA